MGEEGFTKIQATYDGLHPSALGHIEFARKLYEYYQNYYGSFNKVNCDKPHKLLYPENGLRSGMNFNEAPAWLDLWGTKQSPHQIKLNANEVPASFRFWKEPKSLKANCRQYQY